MDQTKPPLISIIAVSYNHARYLIQTLESIALQTISNVELIYCDDASTDNSASLAADWLQSSKIPFRTILNEKNRGLCSTLNLARKVCRGEYIQYVSCDDRLLPRKFELQLAVFARSQDTLAVVCSDANLIDEAGSPMPPYLFTRRYAKPETSERTLLFEQLIRANCISAPSALIKKSALDDVGPYDEAIPFEDYDMWLRLIRKYDFEFMEEPTVEYRIHRQSTHVLLDKAGKWRGIRHHILRKHLDAPYVREIFRKDLTRAVCDNQLPDVSIEDLIACQFDLQEVADTVQKMKNSKTYWACTRLQEAYFALRNMFR